ncbi:MAG: D-alanyl-D-alanine carboxypeptidase/D-alanyl-D-alanine-endopeptidase, partial [Paludibacteraceae bacterium]|nr:D-alanyl-D-alanine carboxypeptidase/D-alanyl-D-alanine-endopeptidase [Paludibacteraceae bacterium]
MPIRNTLLPLLLLLTAAVISAAPVDDFCDRPGMRTANISLLVTDSRTGETVAQYRSQNITPPASTMKLLTTATALESLGADFRFTTYVETDGTVSPNGVLNGNIYIRGTGDPTLCSSTFHTERMLLEWQQQLRQIGVKTVKGDIVADLSAFCGDELNPQWLWEDIGSYYGPGIYPLSYKDNTVTLRLYAGGEGTPLRVMEMTPQLDSLIIDNRSLCTGRIAQTDIYLRGQPLVNSRTLSGYVRPNRGSIVIKGDLPNPGLMLANDWIRQLRTAGISVEGSGRYTLQADGTKRTTLFTHQSPPLREIIAQTNLHSNNMLAEHLFRYLGTLNGKPATLEQSAAYVQAFWEKRIPSVSTAFIFDGSGLSPKDGISAGILVDLLRYMDTQSAQREAWMASLPVSG